MEEKAGKDSENERGRDDGRGCTKAEEEMKEEGKSEKGRGKKEGSGRRQDVQNRKGTKKIV